MAMCISPELLKLYLPIVAKVDVMIKIIQTVDGRDTVQLWERSN